VSEVEIDIHGTCTYCNKFFTECKCKEALADAIRAVPLEHLSAQNRMRIIRFLTPAADKEQAGE
jgi:hypothetical protein